MDTNFFPMAMDATHEGFDGTKIVEYLNKSGALGFAGGLPTSLKQSGEQWDFLMPGHQQLGLPFTDL